MMSSRRLCGPALVTLLAVWVTACGEKPVAAPTDAGFDSGSSDAADGGARPDAGMPEITCDGPAPIADPDAPVVTNFEFGESIRYNLALVRGTAAADATSLQVEAPEGSRAWPVAGGEFKALVPLESGCNVLHLKTGPDQERVLAIRYVPDTNPYYVRLIWIESSDGPNFFDAPPDVPNDTQSAKDRIATAGWLLQTFTAETERDQGFGRRTFRLVLGDDGRPVVDVFKSSLTTAQMRSMEAGDLWWELYQELDALPDGDRTKHLVLIGASHYDAVNKKLLAHMALGGGRQAAFGSTSLFTWARSLDEVVERLEDPRFIDTSVLSDDSAYRGTWWANYATALGAAMHELGHTLSLPHTNDELSVMSRGFDHFNRKIVVHEPPSNVSPGYSPIPEDIAARWDRSASVRLAFHRYLDVGGKMYLSHEAPIATVDANGLRVESDSGLRHVDFQVDGVSTDHEEYLEMAPHSVEFTLDALRSRFPGVTLVHANVEDDDGNISETDVNL